ncbi:MAG: DUF6335 family protein [Chloroflexota bacterium]
MRKKKPEKKPDPVDPYTGEREPVSPDAGKAIEVMPVDTGDREGKDYLLDEETSMDAVAADEHADATAETLNAYTENEDVQADFAERQQLARGGRKALAEQLENHHALSPDISGGDIDAAWEAANAAGEEAVGGTVPTPDQDIVEELGEAVGLTYEDDEPLNSVEKIDRRDRDRWELDPDSVDDETESKPAERGE